MKLKKRLENTTDPREYKRLKKEAIPGACPFCQPHRGCNSRVYIRKNWKHYRKTQYKVIMYDVIGA